MSHSHHHPPAVSSAASTRNAYIVGIGLNVLFVIIEVIAGLRSDSLALLSDAGHNIGDVLGLSISMLAFSLAKIKPNKRYTFGYQKTTILAALTNAIILLVGVGIITWEAILRFQSPQIIQGDTVAIVAFIGILINSLTAFLFFKDRNSDINIKGAFLHLAADAAVSLGVVIGGLLISYTHLFWIDSVLSLIIVVIITLSTLELFKNSLLLSLDGKPDNIDREEIVKQAMAIEGVKQIQHLHIWAISTTKTALTTHLIVENNLSFAETLAIKNYFIDNMHKLNIQHVTVQIESEACEKIPC